MSYEMHYTNEHSSTYKKSLIEKAFLKAQI